MVFHWSLSESKSPQVSRTILSILSDRNNELVWMVSTRPVLSNFSSLYTNSFVAKSAGAVEYTDCTSVER